MAFRTYVPTLLVIARRLQRYVERYDLTIEDNLDSSRLSAFRAFKTALDLFVTANNGFNG